MAPRYLYGDSEDFPGGTDFLAELRQFVAAASKALALGHEADELEVSLGARAQESVAAMDTLQSFFDGISATISERAALWAAPQIVAPHAQKLLDHVASLAEQARSGYTRDLDAAQVDVAARIAECRTKARDAIADYLLHAPLPVSSWAISMILAGEERRGEVLMEHPSELTTSFAIDVDGDPTWGRLRKVGELAPDLKLQVGMKKAFLRSALQPDIAELEDFVISGLKLGPTSMELRLQKKPDSSRDHLVIALAPDELGLPVAQVTRHGDGSDGERFPSPLEDKQKIEALAGSLRSEVAPLLARKTRLVFAQLSGRDVFEQGMVTLLLTRFIERMAPIATEVARHSPNPHELSLKVEREDGRREEIYLRKAELRQMVAPLPTGAKALFERLAFLERSGRPSTVPPPPPKRPL